MHPCLGWSQDLALGEGEHQQQVHDHPAQPYQAEAHNPSRERPQAQAVHS